MRKKLVLLMLVGMSLCVTACGGITVNVETAQSTNEDSDTEGETEDKEETALEESTEDALERQETTIDEAKLEQMLNETLNWAGLQYVYTENPDFKELTVAQAVPMALGVVGETHEDLEQDEEYNLIIPESLLKETMKNLFGKVYDTAEYIPTEYDMARKTEDGSLRLVLGDWGTCVPRFSVEKIEQDVSSNGFIVNVNYYTYDFEEDKNSGTEFVIRYYLMPSEESSYGFVITDMIGEKMSVSKAETNTYGVQEKAYQEILDKYYQAISQKWDMSKMEENGVCYLCVWCENVSKMGYTCIDVDGNGVSELLIGEVGSEGAYVGMFYDMYTIVDNKAVQIVTSGERDRYYLCTDYQIANEGSGSAAESSSSYYFLKDGKTLELKEAVIYDGYYAGAYDEIDNEVNPWFYSTTGFEESDYNPISEEKAKEIMDSYEYMDIEFTPFEE